MSSVSRRRAVFVAYTGGTIGMKRADDGYRPAPGYLAEQVARLPELEDPKMPRLEIRELEPLVDSSNMTPVHWVRMGEAIAARYDEFDGFVVLHGTDTMAYSASALSYMFEGLQKPVVFTGSQIPLVEIRSDARHNLITSLLIAAHQPVPEVCLLVGDRLLRGNRSTKVSAERFLAFDSPNHPPLGTAGVHVEIRRDALRRTPRRDFRFHTVEGAEIADLRIFPGITPRFLRQALAEPVRGAVLHTYGVGNAPDDAELIEAIREATARGVVIVNCTQCLQGSVQMEQYATGRALLGAGVTSGFDMTPEAALTKLVAMLSRHREPEEVRYWMQQDLRGELTRS